jgi:hypothetical protein
MRSAARGRRTLVRASNAVTRHVLTGCTYALINRLATK